MPEGDTIHGAADRLSEVLAGQIVTHASGSHRAMIEFGRRIIGSEIVEATAHGKHLLLHFSNGWTLRTHLQMTGSWHVYAPGERWSKSPGKARVVLETERVTAVCFAAPTVQLAPWHIVAKRIENLGPDLMDDVAASNVADRMFALAAGRAVADTILDQNVMAGIGNVYKSEVLFLEGIHPDTPVASLERPEARALVERSHLLLTANRGKQRTTTGQHGPGHDTWVYGRAGATCRRCGSRIESGTRGPLQRSTYWCPTCQPPPTS